MTPLYFAREPEMAALLIEHGANVNHVVQRGEHSIPLLEAAFLRFPAETIEVILEAGAKPEAVDAKTCAYGALAQAEFGEPGALELFLQLDVEIDPEWMQGELEALKEDHPEDYARLTQLLEERKARSEAQAGE